LERRRLRDAVIVLTIRYPLSTTNHLSWLVGELRALAGELSEDGASPPLLVAIDQGGHATRALAFDTRGRRIAEAYVPISTFRSGTDRVEHDALELGESVRTVLADLSQMLGDDARRVTAAGLATQRSSIACWDRRAAKPFARVLSWQDRRNAAFVAKLAEQEQTIRETTGLVLSPHYGASKLRWYAEHVEGVRSPSPKQRPAFGPLAAWLLHAILEEHPHCVDATNAARTQLLDIRACDWSDEMLALFGVRRELLPTVVPNRYEYGNVLFDDRLVPLVVCTGDQSAMPFAHGAPDAATIYLNVGTGAFVQRISDRAAPTGLLSSVLWHDGERGTLRAIEGTVNGAGSAIDWLNERVDIDAGAGSRAWAHREALAMNRAKLARAMPPIFLNGIAGVGSPYWRAQFESRFIGDGNDIERLMAVIESIAFLICENVAHVREGATRILASGGLADSDYLCECVATLSGLPVERTSLTESTATGLAYLIAREPADWQPEAQIERFDPEPQPELRARYERWRKEMGSA
jgi:glycerol kinase